MGISNTAPFRLIGNDSPSDAYHTNYVLCGLASAQHMATLLAWEAESVANATWDCSPILDDPQIFGLEDLCEATDPVYAIPEKKKKDMIAYFKSKPGF